MTEKKREPFLGRAQDVGKPGLDNLQEVREIVASVVRDFREGIISGPTANRILGRLKRYVRESAVMDENTKKAAITYINGAIRTVRKEYKGKERFFKVFVLHFGESVNGLGAPGR